MKIGVMSDTHDNLEHTRAVLAAYREAGIEQVIHCGDMTTTIAAAEFGGFQVIYVEGNMDRAAASLYRELRDLNPANVALPTFEGTIDGVSIGVTHGHLEEELQRLIRSARHAYVFHGHTHRRRDERIGPTRVFNPGALGGLKFESWSYAIADLAAGDIQVTELG